MYINKIVYENVGPIHDIRISFPFDDNGSPKPIIFVGENGSGKSTILSNIVDSFYEMAGVAYDNACYSSSSGANSHQYYKAISAVQISVGKEYMYSYISFKGEGKNYYLCKAGNISVEAVRQKTGIIDNGISWGDRENYKKTTMEKQMAERIWNSNVICYFGPDRYERPIWMGDKYYQSESFIHPSIHERITGHLNKPISVKSVTSTNLTWLLDIIADSRPDIKYDNGSWTIAHVTISDLLFLGKTRENLETILSTIVGEDVYFALNFRNRGNDRFRIMRKCDDSILSPSLDSLSTGQIALFNMFSTIVRYADFNNIRNSFQLSDIKGIVVIDEIELHLHTKLQKEVLPKLLKLFPKVQFVITTHAPLFLLGMRDVYGEEHFNVYELPTASNINTEKFSEFQKAYQYMRDTETFQKDVEKALQDTQRSGKPIIITEGPTDWKHLKAAYNSLKSSGLYTDLFDDMDFAFFEYESKDAEIEAEHKLSMGNTVLVDICENMSKLPQSIKYIFIADRDDPTTNKKMLTSGSRYKNWGNNVYSLVLPVPQHRSTTPEICIEHYYSDSEIKTEWTNPETGIAHRLFMGNEFDERGIAKDIDRFCEKRNKCGRKSIAIIEGSSGEKVTSISNNNGINYALQKSKFAKMILDGEAPFDNFSFNSFIEVFEIIKEIINDNKAR